MSQLPTNLLNLTKSSNNSWFIGSPPLLHLCTSIAVLFSFHNEQVGDHNIYISCYADTIKPTKSLQET